MDLRLGGQTAFRQPSDDLIKHLAHLRRLEADLGVGEPEGRQTGSSMSLVAASIPGLLSRRAVVSEAVRFDNQPKPGPVEVHAKPIDPGARLRHRQPGAPNQA
jgi:hypothetical protein